MATKVVNNIDESPEEGGQFRAIGKNIQENPGMWIASILIVVVVFASSAAFRLKGEINAREQASAYAAATDLQDPIERIAALGVIADSDSRYATEARYLEGFTAMNEGDFATAEAAFTDIRENNPNFEFAPDALEGLGAIKESNGDYAGAIAIYNEVATSWPNTFAARRQPFNIGRSHDLNGNTEEAIKAFQEQLAQFPDSNVAQRASLELSRLQAENPGLDTDSNLITLPE